MANRYERSIYEYYKQYHRDLVDVVYNQATTSDMRRIFLKKWGQNLRGGVLSPLTDHEQALFLEYDETFKKYLNIAQKLKSEGYSLSQIKEYLSSSMHPTTTHKSTMMIYSTLNDFLRKYNITMKELESILVTLPKLQARCFILYYGVNRAKKVSIDHISDALRLGNHVVIANIKAVYAAVEKYQIEHQVLNTKLPPVEEKRTWEKSIYNYFTPEEKEYVPKAIEWYRNHKIKYFDVILKCYGRNYDQWNSRVKLTKEEENRLGYIIGSDLPNLVNQIKHNNLKRGAGAKRKKSIYDYFEEVPDEKVKEIIETWKIEHIDYYNLIVKLYGETYDYLDTTIELTEDETKLWNHLLADLKDCVYGKKEETTTNKSKGRQRKSSIYDYFEEDEKEYVTERIEWWKTNNKTYYDLIVKLYSPTYDQLNTKVKLVGKESKMISNIITLLKVYVSERKQGISSCQTNSKAKKQEVMKTSNDPAISEEKKAQSNSKKEQDYKENIKLLKSSMYEYVKEEDAPYLLERIEWCRTHNTKYYNLIVKLYGPTYDCLDTTVQLSDDEIKIWKNMIGNLPTQIAVRKSRAINRDNKNNTKQHPIKKQNIEETVESMKTDIIGNKELFEHSVTREVNTKTKVSGFKKSIYDYFAEDEKVYVTEKINSWKICNIQCYNLIVKLYGPTYDQLNSEVELTNLEMISWKFALENIKKYVSRKKQVIGQPTFLSQSHAEEETISSVSKQPDEITTSVSKQEHVEEKEIITCINNKEALDASPQELVLLAYFEQHDTIKEQELCDVLGISIEELDCFYAKYLHMFGEKMPQVIETMIKRNSNNANRILNESYLKEYMTYLTVKEKIYLQLKLQSYTNPNLTDEVIANWIGLTAQELEQYEIMTPYDELNQLNQFIKK